MRSLPFGHCWAYAGAATAIASAATAVNPNHFDGRMTDLLQTTSVGAGRFEPGRSPRLLPTGPYLPAPWGGTARESSGRTLLCGPGGVKATPGSPARAPSAR